MDTFFTCDVNGCDRQFATSQALNAHLEKVHGLTDAPKTSVPSPS